MSLELFHAHNSTCSQQVRLCQAEKGIRDWISRPVDIAKRENLSPEYLAINHSPRRAPSSNRCTIRGAIPRPLRASCWSQSWPALPPSSGHLIKARTDDGRKRAKARGVRFGRPRKLDQHQRREALQRLTNGETLVDVAQTFGVDPTTIGRFQSPFVLGGAAALTRP
jgi:hypothetical protein